MTTTDYRFAPSVAAPSGILGGLLAALAAVGWEFVWPAIAVLFVCGLIVFATMRRRGGEPRLWRPVLATSFTTVSAVAAVWGLVSGAAV